jgi:hypothetical protein
MFKNTDDKLIIIYDEDESIASKVAQQFAMRDINNIWMVSGGKAGLCYAFAFIK